MIGPRFLRPACLATIAFTSLGLTGCAKPADEQAEQAQAEVAVPENPALQQVELQRVAPGTPLTEADFRHTLQATGAELVVVQVYLDACGPCITEALKLTQIEAEWHSQGIAILGLGMDETPAGPESFFNSTGGRIKFPLYLAPWFAKQQQVEATPVLFIYSSTGEQLHRTNPQETDIEAVDEICRKLTELQAKL